MAADDYRFPLDERPPVDATDAQLAAYEETVVRSLNDWLTRERGGSYRGHSGLLLSIHLDREESIARLRLHYRSHAGGEYDAYYPIWDDQGVSDPPLVGGRPCLESPASLGGLVVANWADGSIHAEDDPYWDAVERQRQAIADWRAGFPDAAAALPMPQRDQTPEQYREAWNQWTQEFPEAAARHKEVWRPVEDFLE